MDNKKNYRNLKIDNKDNSEIEIEAEIPEETILKYKDKAIKKLGKNVSIDGFRKGNIPEKILLEKVSEQLVLEEQVQMALAEVYPSIVEDNNLQVIGRPEVRITKMAPKNPVQFKITSAVMPEVKLPDYKKIATEIKLDEKFSNVTDKELAETLEQIKKGIETHRSKPKASSDTSETLTPADESKSEKDVVFTDELVRTLGDFKDLSDFKTKIKDNLIKEKEAKSKEKRRIEIMEKIIEESTINVPKILVESELDKMLAQFKDDVLRMNIQFDEYLTKIKKTEDSLRTEWKMDAEKRAKMQLILNEIAVKENVKVESEEIEKETNHILKHYKDAKPENVRMYIETVLTNEKIFQLLEKQV